MLVAGLAALVCGSLAAPCAAQLTETEWTEMGRGIYAIDSGETAGAHHQSGRAWQVSSGFDTNQGAAAIWVGTSHGGLWKSILNSDGLVASWRPLTEDFPGPHTLGAFVVHRGNSDKILIGTGAPLWGSGDGIVYRSDDEGATWAPHPLPAASVVLRVNRLLETPDASGNVVLAATSRGIFRSVDFGNSWTHVFVGARRGDVDEVTDVVVNSDNSSSFYAADPGSRFVSGGNAIRILRSTDYGVTWKPFEPGAGRITGDTTRIHLATCASDPDVLYALATKSTGALNGVYRSVDRARNWTRIFANNTAINLLNQGPHTGAIACDPTDPSHIFFGIQEPKETFNARAPVGSIVFTGNDSAGRSTLDGGHNDFNGLQFRSDGRFLWVANDGGIYFYDPATQTAGDSWNLLGIDALELTPNQGGFTSTRAVPHEFLAGLQDNGLIRGDARYPTFANTLLAPGDGGDVTSSPVDIGTLAATSTLFSGGVRSQSFDDGVSWTGVDGTLVGPTIVGGAPVVPRILIDPTPGVAKPRIFTSGPAGGSGQLAGIFFKGTYDATTTWKLVGKKAPKGTVARLDHLTSDQVHLIPFALKNDQRMFLYHGPRGTLGSLDYDNVTPPVPNTTNGAPDARINADRSTLQPLTVYYSTGVSRPSRAYYNLSAGYNWPLLGRDVTGNLPGNMDYNRLIGNPTNLSELFLASSDGVWRSDDGGVCWSRYSRGLRTSEEVLDIVINPEDSPPTLYIATKGRGFWGRAIGAPAACGATVPSAAEGKPSPLADSGAAYWGTTKSPELADQD
jgi:photosystem II stability/assembly factor-like uncharacterized protein